MSIKLKLDSKTLLEGKQKTLEPLLADGFFLAKNEGDLQRITDYKKSYYSDDRPSVQAFHHDGFDQFSHVIYGVNHAGEITSTSRLLMDGEWGFPEEEILPDAVHALRQQGKRLAELGRLLITDDKVNGLRTHYKFVYEASKALSIDYVLVVMKQQNISSHEKMMPIEVLSMDMGLSWDEEQAPLCLVLWDMTAPQPKFHQWISRGKFGFKAAQWNVYGDAHSTVFTSLQREIYQCLASRVTGSVLDLGCGSARVMAYMQDNLSVTQYLGVDASPSMIDKATCLRDGLQFTQGELLYADLLVIQGHFDSIISVHSYYSWAEKPKCLSHIRNLLTEEGVFHLVTPNDGFDAEKLAHVAKQELLGHPYYDEFMNINYSIAETAKKENVYVPLDQLIEQVKTAGFKVKSAQDAFFLGGASYLVLGKS